MVWVVAASQKLVWIGDIVPDEYMIDELLVDDKLTRLDKDS